MKKTNLKKLSKTIALLALSASAAIPFILSNKTASQSVNTLSVTHRIGGMVDGMAGGMHRDVKPTLGSSDIPDWNRATSDPKYVKGSFSACKCSFGFTNDYTGWADYTVDWSTPIEGLINMGYQITCVKSGTTYVAHYVKCKGSYTPDCGLWHDLDPNHSMTSMSDIGDSKEHTDTFKASDSSSCACWFDFGGHDWGNDEEVEFWLTLA